MKQTDQNDMIKLGFTKFRPGAKYIRFLNLDNYNNIPNTKVYFKNIKLEEIE